VFAVLSLAASDGDNQKSNLFCCRKKNLPTIFQLIASKVRNQEAEERGFAAAHRGKPMAFRRNRFPHSF